MNRRTTSIQQACTDLLQAVHSFLTASQQPLALLQILNETESAMQTDSDNKAQAKQYFTPSLTTSAHFPPIPLRAHLSQVSDDSLSLLQLQGRLGLDNTKAAPKLAQAFIGQELREPNKKGEGGGRNGSQLPNHLRS